MKYLVALFLVLFSISSFSQTLDWARFNKSTLNAVSRGVVLDKNQNSYSTLDFRETVDADPTSGELLLTGNQQDIFLQKLDSAGNFIWAKHITGKGNESAKDIVIDSDANIYIAGEYLDSINFEDNNSNALFVNPANPASYDYFIAKFDSAGNFLWAKTFGSPTQDAFNKMMMDDDDNVYLEGQYLDSIDMDPGPGTYMFPKPTSNFGRFLLKLDTAGKFIWANSYDQPVTGITYVTDNDGGLYGAGNYQQSTTIDFDPGPGVYNINAEWNSRFIFKLDTAGNFIWAKVIEGNLYGTDLTIDGNNDLIISGAFIDTFDMDPGTGVSLLNKPSGYRDAYLIKLDSAGNFKWGKALQSRENSIYLTQALIRQLSTDKFNNIYSFGIFRDTVDFDPSGNEQLKNTIIPNATDCFVLKLTANGDFKWVTHLEHTNPGYNAQSSTPADIKISNENVYITGAYFHPMDFDPGAGTLIDSSEINYANYIVKLKQSKTIEATLDSNVCDSFIFNGTAYYTDKSIVKMDTTAIGQDSATFINYTVNFSKSTVFNETACDSLTFYGNTYYATGTYKQYLTTSEGCDSVITLNLTVNKSVNTVLNEVACDSFQLNDSVYYASGTYYQKFAAANTCDSVVTLNLTINNSDSKILTEIACDSFTLNDSTYTESGIYTQHLKTTKGCDSTIILNLTINKIDAEIVKDGLKLYSPIDSASFRWLICSDNYKALDGETDSTLYASITASYAVEVTKNGCIDTSECINITVDGVEFTNFPGTISAYPNPTNKQVYIDLGQVYNHLTVEVYDVLGRAVKQVKVESANELSIDIEGATGIYYVHIKTKEYSTKIKVIKN